MRPTPTKRPVSSPRIERPPTDSVRRFLLSLAVCVVATAGVAGPIALKALEARSDDAPVVADTDGAPARIAFVDPD